MLRPALHPARLARALRPLALALALLAPPLSPAWAQTPSTGTIFQTPETVRPETAPPESPGPPILPAEERPAPAPAEGETIFIRDISIEDPLGLVDPSLLAPILAPYLGRDLTLGQLEEAAGRVTAAYQERGFILAQAYLPPQDASGGDLTIAVLVGRYGGLTIRNESRLRDGVVERALASAGKAGEPVRGPDLERAILLLGGLPGGETPRITVSPGAEFGVTDLLVEVGPGRRVEGYTLIDNQGSRYTGRFRFGAGLSVNSLMGLGDQLNFNGMISDEGDGLVNGRLAYSVPLWVYGPTLTVAAYRTTYELGLEYDELDAVGVYDGVEASLSYHVIRSRDLNLAVSATAARRAIRDEIGVFDLVQRKTASVGTLGVEFDTWLEAFGGRDLHLEADGSVSFGRLRSPDDPLNPAAGRFTKGNASASAWLRLTENFSARLGLEAQRILSGRRLDASEQMIVTGPGGIRAYRESVSGDNGWLGHVELTRTLPPAGRLVHSVGIFAATGRSWNKDPQFDVVHGYTLSNVGLSYRASFEPFFLNLNLASAVGPWPELYRKEGRTQLMGQFGLVF